MMGLRFLARLGVIVAILAILFFPTSVLAEIVTTPINVTVFENTLVIRAEEGLFNLSYVMNESQNISLTLIRDLTNNTNVTILEVQNITFNLSEKIEFSCPLLPDVICEPARVVCPSVVDARLDNESLRDLFVGASNGSMQVFFDRVDNLLVPSQQIFEQCQGQLRSLELSNANLRGDIQVVRAVGNSSAFQFDSLQRENQRLTWIILGMGALFVLVFAALSGRLLPFIWKKDWTSQGLSGPERKK